MTAEPPRAASRSKTPWLWASAILVLLMATALVAPAFNRTMRYDEAFTAIYYSHSALHTLVSYTAPNNHILHSLLAQAAMRLIGSQPLAVRFPALAAGLLALAMVIRLGRRLGDRRIGLAGAALLAINPTFVDYTINARGFTLTLLLTLVLLELTLFARKTRTRRYRYALIGVAAAAILTLTSMAILIAGVMAWIIWQAGGFARRAVSEKIVPLLVGCIVGGVFYLPALAMGWLGSHFDRFGYDDPVLLLADWLRLAFTPILPGLLIALGLVVGLWVAQKRRSGPSNAFLRWVVCLYGAAASLALVQWMITGTLFYPRNYFYLLAPLALLAGMGLARLAGRTMTLLAILIVGAGFVTLSGLDAPTAVDTLADLVRQNPVEDRVLIGCCLEEPVFYHLRLSGEAERLLGAPESGYFVVIGDFQPWQEVLAAYKLSDRAESCVLLTDSPWEPFSAYRCEW